MATWTFRPENYFLPGALQDHAGDGARNPTGSVAEIRHYLAAGVDAFFTDDPAYIFAAFAVATVSVYTAIKLKQ